LRLGVAGGLEIDFSKRAIVRARGLRQRNAGRKYCHNCKGFPHRASPFFGRFG
jgi:hypothetical protein